MDPFAAEPELEQCNRQHDKEENPGHGARITHVQVAKGLVEQFVRVEQRRIRRPAIRHNVGCLENLEHRNKADHHVEQNVRGEQRDGDAEKAAEPVGAIDSGRFRLDLYHRLCVLEITVPPLREREQDVVTLAESFLAQESLAAGRKPPVLSDDAREYLVTHNWPGNIRELRNLCIRWLLTASDGIISTADIPESRQTGSIRQPTHQTVAPMREVADDLIRHMLEQTDGNVSEAARRLGIDRSTIYRRRQNWPGHH